MTDSPVSLPSEQPVSDSAKAGVKKNPRRKGRSLQRQRALDVLFEADVRNIEREDLEALLRERQSTSTAQQPIQEYGSSIVLSYARNAEDVDAYIDAASPAWSLSRMSAVDRNILRIGTAEFLYLGVDLPILAKEVASLARDFSSEKSVSFTMGVLNRIAEIYALETSGSGFSDSDSL